MGMIQALADRRSIYALDKNLPVPEAEVEALVRQVTELVPDAFNMKSARVAVALGRM